MTPKFFTGLTFTALGSLLLAAVVHTRADSWVSGTASGAKLLPSLQRDMPRIAIIIGGMGISASGTAEAFVSQPHLCRSIGLVIAWRNAVPCGPRIVCFLSSHSSSII